MQYKYGYYVFKAKTHKVMHVTYSASRNTLETYMFGSELIFSNCAVHKYFSVAKFLKTPRLSSVTPSYGVMIHSLRNWVLDG